MKNIKLRTKLIGGFFGSSLITLLVGIIGWLSLSNLDRSLREVGLERLPAVQNLLEIEIGIETVRSSLRELIIINIDMEDRKRAYESIARGKERYQSAVRNYASLEKSQSDEELWNEFIVLEQEWLEEIAQFLAMSKRWDAIEILNPYLFDARLADIKAQYSDFMRDTANLIFLGIEFEGGDDHKSSPYSLFLEEDISHTRDPDILAYFEEISEPHIQFHQSISDIKEMLRARQRQNAIDIYTDVLIPSADRVFDIMDNQILLESDTMKILHNFMAEQLIVSAQQKGNEAKDILSRLILQNEQYTQATVDRSYRLSIHSKLYMLIAILIGVSGAMTLGLLLSTNITRSIKNAILTLKGSSSSIEQSAYHISASSTQVSSTSQNLAEASTEQAATSQETASTLEELSNMTMQNSDNSKYAENLMKDTYKVVTSANDTMQNLVNSMDDISRASEDTSNIIKTIDELAFQTNLLALNAAIEAARAGEAGAGFAVVANEVRKLANDSAVAAQNISELIQDIVQKIRSGNQIVDETGKIFGLIKEKSSKVRELVSEIAAASSEQTKGISQINAATSELDKITQRNAAGAQESAASSEELAGQAEHMKHQSIKLKEIVRDLAILIGESHKNKAPKGRKPDRPSQKKFKTRTTPDNRLLNN